MRCLKHIALRELSFFIKGFLTLSFHIPGEEHTKLSVRQFQDKRCFVAGREFCALHRAQAFQFGLSVFFGDLISCPHDRCPCSILPCCLCQFQQFFIEIFLRRQHEIPDSDTQVLVFEKFPEPIDMVFVPVGGKYIIQGIHSVRQKIRLDPVYPR